MLTELCETEFIVGTKQTLKAIKEKRVSKVFLADDIDQHIKEEILYAVKDNNIPFEMVESKMKLGRECGIDVSAASAALLK
ncbi:MAG: ribosomal L7Ae/L30e/S12e/Gadd45 family protein [Bacillota bacterium]